MLSYKTLDRIEEYTSLFSLIIIIIATMAIMVCLVTITMNAICKITSTPIQIILIIAIILDIVAILLKYIINTILDILFMKKTTKIIEGGNNKDVIIFRKPGRNNIEAIHSGKKQRKFQESNNT